MTLERNFYIGSSDAQDIIDGNFLSLYNKKMVIYPPDDLSDVFPVQLGKLTEDFHLDWTIRRLNEEKGSAFEWTKTRNISGEEHQHEAIFYPDRLIQIPMGSHPDALIRQPGSRDITYPVEVKITGRWPNADLAADFYMAQIQHHMICWGADQLLFSVICGTSEPERIWVGYSPEWADFYIDRCEEFWKYVIDETPPTPQFFPDSKKVSIPTAVKDSVPIDGMKRRSLEGNNRAATLIPEFIRTKREVKAHEEIKKELKSMMQPDEKELYHDDLVLKRNKAGSILFTVKNEDAK